MLLNGLPRYILYHMSKPNVTRFQSATEWTALVPNNFRSTSKDIPMYIRMWQWRHWHSSQHASLHVIADFDRQSSVKETQQVRQSKQKNKTVTFSVAETHTKHKFPSKQRQTNRCVETIKTQNELKKTMYFQLPTLNPAKKVRCIIKSARNHSAMNFLY